MILIFVRGKLGNLLILYYFFFLLLREIIIGWFNQKIWYLEPVSIKTFKSICFFQEYLRGF